MHVCVYASLTLKKKLIQCFFPRLALETFLLAVTLSTFTTVPCLCLLGPNFKAWLRVFSRNG